MGIGFHGSGEYPEDIEEVKIPLLHRPWTRLIILKGRFLLLCLVHKITAVNSGVCYETIFHSDLLGCETQAMKEMVNLSCCGGIDHLWVNAGGKCRRCSCK